MKKWILRFFLLLFITVLLGFGYYVYLIWSAAHRSYVPPEQEKSDKRQEAVKWHEDPVAILMLGVDERNGDQGRADTIMIAALNPQEKDIVLTNIPRDTRVEIPGKNFRDKINHSYAYGGVDLTRKTVEQFLDLPIDGYVQINMQGLKEIVDELGGIDVEVPFTFSYGGHTFKKGPMHLNGEETLAFARMRKEDPLGDFGRIQRQQEVIRAIVRKGTDWTTITKLDTIMEKLGSNVKTDISPFQLLQLQNRYANLSRDHIKTVRFKGEDATIDGIYYFRVSPEEIKRVRKVLAEQLNYTRPPDTLY
ncbi:LCP family protein [Thermoactinomyces intermedius]|jgi:polyisoprenyl-teichoic acid--peptidoglycan teichoic acid transferase|uniref:LCP family protein n=1 Tax=Thermoactinomyces intermedius TaxID=2024 RepID=A0A8I1DEJ7_THEIN|nr:LCP family protein [Thermoactinomyces intermedius]MBA4548173.1 LCP family protein [Thermoactinomyces intermedius]MBA4835263.1 LCP family protein [Thermoactinomyces intermedius]MBH8595017.1 LCP family protein [Thermoactinomyces intermedius]